MFYSLLVLQRFKTFFFKLYLLNLINFFLIFKYANPVADLLDKYGTFSSRLFRESCVIFEGNYVKVCCFF